MGILLDTFKRNLAGAKLRKTTSARKWLFNKANGISVNRQKMLRSGTVSEMLIGQLFFFFYDPKTKATLPYYDRFPLVIPIEPYGDGFLGLNLHYLEPGLRVILLDKLFEYANNKKMNKTTRMKLSYSLISSASKLEIAQPCIKRYLYSHITSKFIYVEPEEYDLAAFLPTEMFVGSTKNHVWKDSRSKF